MKCTATWFQILYPAFNIEFFHIRKKKYHSLNKSEKQQENIFPALRNRCWEDPNSYRDSA